MTADTTAPATQPALEPPAPPVPSVRQILETVLDGAIQHGEDHPDDQPTSAQVAAQMEAALTAAGHLLAPSVVDRLYLAEELAWVFSRSPQPTIPPDLPDTDAARVRAVHAAGLELLARWTHAAGPAGEKVRAAMTLERVDALAADWSARRAGLFQRRLVMGEPAPANAVDELG